MNITLNFESAERFAGKLLEKLPAEFHSGLYLLLAFLATAKTDLEALLTECEAKDQELEELRLELKRKDKEIAGLRYEVGKYASKSAVLKKVVEDERAKRSEVEKGFEKSLLLIGALLTDDLK